jgi:hypothetical protein
MKQKAGKTTGQLKGMKSTAVSIDALVDSSSESENVEKANIVK